MKPLLLYTIIISFNYLSTATDLTNITTGDPPYRICSNTDKNYTNNTSFKTNLLTLLQTLSSKAAVTNYANFAAGNGTNTVYGLYMCFNYRTIDCQTCIATTASLDITKYCPNTRAAIVWEDKCLLRYGDDNFFGKLDVTGNVPKSNVNNVSDPELYKHVVNTSLVSLIRKAAFSPDMSATKIDAFTKTDTIYALAQCTRDLSADDCYTCLETAVKEVLSCCYFLYGVRLHSRSCFLRYEFNPFVNGVIESSVEDGNHGGKYKSSAVIIAVVAAVVFLIILVCSGIYCYKKRMRNREGIKSHEFYIDLKSISLATNHFSHSNLLGEGGFGPVYKGKLSDGREVAVKRLSRCSEQGTEEFTNEVLLILKLQHRNLVRLLGFCVDRDEKLLVYEYMPNSSLDFILFDAKKREKLGWNKRISIVNGIAKGILYLHVDSRLRIIHRDLKASNILLDDEMNPKISDFGMARIFAESEDEANTARIVGTYGYMAPEYAMEGLYSIKSDVYSFGVLLIEIITGKRNAGFHQSGRATSLLAYAWQLWNEGNVSDLMDPLLCNKCNPEEFLRHIHIGLLCVQEDALDRPTMSSVVVMLKGETTFLQKPEKPAFSTGRFTNKVNVNNHSVNAVSVSEILPR